MKWQKGDFLIIAVVFLAACLILSVPFARIEPTDVDVFADGKLVYTSSIATPFEKEISGCTIKLSDGKVRVVSSTCPDKVCVNTGEISSAGELIVCVPNRVSVKMEGREEFDAIAN